MTDAGKTLVQIQAERMAQSRFTDLMASAGVSYTRMSQEILWFLPDNFVTEYSTLFHKAFGGKDDGGVNARGQSAAESGSLQKGKAAAKTNGKKYKKHWVIADEHAMRLKERIDKRLRAMARDIVEELEAAHAGEAGAASGKVDERSGCAGCGRFSQVGWKFCPSCGSSIDAHHE